MSDDVRPGYHDSMFEGFQDPNHPTFFEDGDVDWGDVVEAGAEGLQDGPAAGAQAALTEIASSPEWTERPTSDSHSYDEAPLGIEDHHQSGGYDEVGIDQPSTAGQPTTSGTSNPTGGSGGSTTPSATTTGGTGGYDEVGIDQPASSVSTSANTNNGSAGSHGYDEVGTGQGAGTG